MAKRKSSRRKTTRPRLTAADRVRGRSAADGRQSSPTNAPPPVTWERCRECLDDCRIAKQLDVDAFFHVPLPGVLPPRRAGRTAYVFVGSEPSNAFARSAGEASRRSGEGWRNFCYSPGDFCLQFAIEMFLLRSGECYYLTNLGKCALPTGAAKTTSVRRYRNCERHLQAEIDHFPALSAVVAIGLDARQHLVGQAAKSWPTIEHVTHHAANKGNFPPAEAGFQFTADHLARFAQRRRKLLDIADGEAPRFDWRHVALIARYRDEMLDIRRRVVATR